MATGQITVTATAAAIMDVLADLPGMLEWSAADTVTVTECDSAGRPTSARWHERYGPVSDEFVLQYQWDDDGVSWRLLQGRILKKEDGRYRLAAAAVGQTTVAYTLELGFGVWVLPCIRSRVESMVVGQTLAALKRRVETA